MTSTDSLEDFNQYFKSKRDQYLVEIRKHKNGNFIKEKRMKMATADTTSSDQTFNESQPTNEPIDIQEKLNRFASCFIQALKVGDLENVPKYAEKIRRAISEDENPPLQELLNTGVVEYVANLLDPQYYSYESTIIECSWIMANFTSGNSAFTNYAVELGIVLKALDLLDHHPTTDVKENAVWILANVAGESLEFRDSLLEGGIVTMIELLLQNCDPTKTSLLANIAWLMSDLSRGKPYPNFKQIAPFLPWLEFFLTIEDDQVFSNSLWALSYISDGDNNQIQQILNTDLYKKIIEALGKPSLQIRVPALRTIGNLLTGDDGQTEILTQHGVIDAIIPLMDSSNKLLRREACWTLSNLMAGSSTQLNQILEFSKGLIVKKLFHLIEEDDFMVAKECTYCLINACYSGTIQQIAQLVDFGIVELLIETLKQNGEAKFLKNCIGGLEAILDAYQNYEEPGMFEKMHILERIATCNGYTILEDLQSHADHGVYKAVAKLIEEFFEYDN